MAGLESNNGWSGPPILWGSGSTEFFSHLEMARVLVCWMKLMVLKSHDLWALWSWNISNGGILMVPNFGRLCSWNCMGRMPPRILMELALLVLRAFPALRAALWTCSQQPKVWCRRGLWKAQKGYSKSKTIPNLPSNSIPCIYPLCTTSNSVGQNLNRTNFLANRAMDTPGPFLSLVFVG